MATLKYHWKLDDGTGIVASESIASNDMDITVVSGSPNWVSEGIEFNGEAFGTTGTPRAIAETYGYAGCNIASTGATLVVRFKLTSTNYGFLFGACTDPSGVNGPKCRYGIYVGSDNKLYVAGQYAGGGGADYIVSVPSTSLVNDDSIHYGVFQIVPGPTGWLETLYIWVDGALQRSEQVLSTVAHAYSQVGDRFYLGMADLYSSSGTVYWEGIGTLQPGTIDAVIYDAQFYCGVLTQSEIENLFPTQPANSIMFSCNT
jgi:hypothetical protein